MIHEKQVPAEPSVRGDGTVANSHCSSSLLPAAAPPSSSLYNTHTTTTMGGGKTLDFPANFILGTATAAYQIEGGWEEGGKGWSIWDSFSQTQGETIHDGSNGKITCDHYHLYEQDIKLMADLGFKNYRFSISWPRIQPTGRGKANQGGIDFYNGLIDCLLAHGIEPSITLYHWDMPLALQIEFGGWMGREIVDCFREFSRHCFYAFGDRVKRWITLNEPWCTTVLGYGNGVHAPGIKSEDGSKVYLAAHHCLLAHAAAVQAYRSEYVASQQGEIGITLNSIWAIPKEAENAEGSAKNAAAAERCMLFSLGWFADPIWKGDYPLVMREQCGERLPVFTPEEREMVLGSSDFLGLNYYLSDIVEDCPRPGVGYFTDQHITSTGHEGWKRSDMGWNVVPRGLRCLLLWAQNRYSPKGGLYVTENGCAVDEPDVIAAKGDSFRVSYIQEHLCEVHKAIQFGADVRGYFAWSCMDNSEWAFGLTKRFGIIHVDYQTLKRTVKESARLLSRVSATQSVEEPENPFFNSNPCPEVPAGGAFAACT
jgi:beta-galactosidase